jgi:phytoene desaturase
MHNSNKINNKVIIIGSGIGGLGTACMLGKAGYEVTLLEKNSKIGGRANIFEANGFRFDMGPSWYLMPDVFEHFFNLMGEKIEDHLDLQKLDPSYRIVFTDTGKVVEMKSNIEEDSIVFEELEPGSSKNLKRYLELSKQQYEIALSRFMYKNYNSLKDFFSWEMMIEGRKLSVFSKMQTYVEKFFKTDYVQKIMQYQLVFLGSSPYNTPALYNIMSHIDFNMGVFYPKGGIYEIIIALERITKKYNVKIRTNSAVKQILVEQGEAKCVILENGEKIFADIIISNADIHHTETKLLANESRTYKEDYWEKKTLAPSAFIMYLGIDKKYPDLRHHTLMFSKDWKKNFAEIFDNPTWPEDPSYYVCAPSVTDKTVAPEGKENLFVLVPIAPGLEDTDEVREEYSKKVISMLEKHLSLKDLNQHIEFKRIYCVRDFANDYNSYKGSALGLAHTLRQTAIFRPDTKSKKVKNLYYVGGNTNPGIGMPICLISAELVYKRLIGDNSSGPLNSL